MSSPTAAREETFDRSGDPVLAPTVVRASAGTGKTYQLTARLLRILFQGTDPETVLATTFTRKAAGEILDRILLGVARGADPSDPEALASLRAQVGIPTLSHRACLQLVRRLVRDVHRLRICTLDSLFSQLARTLPFELNLPPGWRLTDEIEEVWIRERAVNELVRHLEAAEMTSLLAMLGKGDIRRSVARDLIGIVQEGYTLQRQCGAEAWEKLAAAKSPDASELTRVAGHFRQAKLPQNSLRSKLEKIAERLELRELDSLAGDTLIRNIASARRTRAEVRFGRSKFPESLDEAFDVLYEAVRAETLQLLKAQNLATGTLLAHYDRHVTRIKESAGALGFDDIAVRLSEHFDTLGDQALLERMDAAVDHLLLDEFQDTSPIQWRVLRPLAVRAAAGAPDESRSDRSFFCVGDTKQAIYGWRGGVAEIFDAVADELDGVRELEQNTNYRSSHVILDVVNRVFKNLPRHPLGQGDANDPLGKESHEATAVRRFAERFPEHHAARPDLPGYVCFQTASAADEGDSEAIRSALNDDVAARIESIHRAAPGRSLGVLTRTNKRVAELIHLIESRGVNVSQEGGNPLTDSAAVEIVLSALMLAEHPGDGRWAYHVAASPLGEPLGLAADGSPHVAGAKVRRLVEQRGLTEAVEWLAGRVAPACDHRDTHRLRQLVLLATEYEPSATARLRDFARLVREKRVERPQAAPVRVMTVHQAKGLEFDAVVLPEIDASLVRTDTGPVADAPNVGHPPRGITRYLNKNCWHFLPERWQRAFGDQVGGAMTEALCLLYVAMTRPRHALYLVTPPARKKDFSVRTAASLIYHALGCEADPTEGSQTLFEWGDPRWFEALPDRGDEGTDKRVPADVNAEATIRFRPTPDVPHRNRAAQVHAQLP